MGRRDSLTASKAAATNNIPAPNSSVATLVANFQNVGLTQNDMVALSGKIFVSQCMKGHFCLLNENHSLIVIWQVRTQWEKRGAQLLALGSRALVTPVALMLIWTSFSRCSNYAQKLLTAPRQ
jgi:hypothetical protein